ncbi:MAG: hypothetical protein J2P53_17185 [Bradyrhizobiaceae bacterium]|nr:hypothetical protein [Bradyrhizobiaceae bacterium]
MADTLALKLLVAGIVGAVVGAAAAERYHPTGLVYGPFNNRPSTYRPRSAIDPTMGSANADGYGYDYAPADRPQTRWRETPPSWDWPRRRYRPPPRPQARSAWCWEEYEEWDFGTTRRYVRCAPEGPYRPPWSL